MPKHAAHRKQEAGNLIGILRRPAIGLCLAVAMLALPLGSTQAAAPEQPTGTTRNGPDVSTPASAHAVMQSEATALDTFQLDLQTARPFLSVDRHGYFQVGAGYQPRPGGFDVRSHLTTINAKLQGSHAEQQRAELLRAAGISITAEAGWCFYIPNWALDAYAYYVIVAGGVTATVSLFVDATILGLPAGAVLGVLGIWVGITGGFLLWYFDKYYPDGAWVCL